MAGDQSDGSETAVKVVVAGGSGLIGRHLVRGLLAEQHDVTVLSRNPERARSRLPAGTRVVGWDPSGMRLDWATHLANSRAMVNLCGESIGRWPWTPARRRLLRDSRLEPTHALIDAVASLPPSERPGALLNASTVDVYDGADTEPASEATPPCATPLARLAADWETAALTAEDLAVRVVLLRFGLVIAPDSAGLCRGPLGSGQQWVSWVAIEDAVALMLRAISGWDIGGPLNIVAPQPVRQAEFAAALGRALGRPSRVRTPAWLLRLVLGSQSALLLGSRRAVPAKAFAASYEFRGAGLEQALVSAVGGYRRLGRGRGRTRQSDALSQRPVG
jgi:uncharacterized protein